MTKQKLAVVLIQLLGLLGLFGFWFFFSFIAAELPEMLISKHTLMFRPILDFLNRKVPCQ